MIISSHKTPKNQPKKKSLTKYNLQTNKKASQNQLLISHVLSVHVVTLIFDLPVRSDIQRKGNLWGSGPLSKRSMCFQNAGSCVQRVDSICFTLMVRRAGVNSSSGIEISLFYACMPKDLFCSCALNSCKIHPYATHVLMIFHQSPWHAAWSWHTLYAQPFWM